MPDSYITLSQARDDVSQITRENDELAEPLIRILRGFAPEDGDPVLFSIADQLIRELTLLLPEFEEFYSGTSNKAQVVNFQR